MRTNKIDCLLNSVTFSINRILPFNFLLFTSICNCGDVSHYNLWRFCFTWTTFTWRKYQTRLIINSKVTRYFGLSEGNRRTGYITWPKVSTLQSTILAKACFATSFLGSFWERGCLFCCNSSVIFFFWRMWIGRWIRNVQSICTLVWTIITPPLVHIHQMKKPAPRIAAKINCKCNRSFRGDLRRSLYSQVPTIYRSVRKCRKVLAEKCLAKSLARLCKKVVKLNYI